MNGSTLATWREAFLQGGLGALRTRKTDERSERIKVLELERKLGKVVMENELLQEKIERIEGGRPLARRRSRK